MAAVQGLGAIQRVELLGANTESVSLTGSEARTSVALDAAVKSKVTESLTLESVTPPDRIFLNLENVRGLNDATVFSVYINVPDGEDPARHPEGDTNAGTDVQVAAFEVERRLERRMASTRAMA